MPGGGAGGSFRQPHYEHERATAHLTGESEPSSIDLQKARTDDLANMYLGERDRPGYVPDRVTPERTTYVDPGQVLTYDAVDPGVAAAYQAATAEGAKDVQVGPLNPVERVSARDVTAPGDATQAGYERVQAAQLDTAAADQVRGRQQGYLDTLERSARGEGPSVAEGMYSSKLADVERNALGIAGQARGSDKAYARLRAMQEVADQTRRAAFDAAQLKGQEAIAAQQGLGGALANVRGTDLDQAKIAAGMRQEAALANQREVGTSERFNADAANRRAEFSTGVEAGNADRALNAATTNAGATNTRTVDEARLRAGVAEGNAGRQQQNSQFNATQTNQASAQNTEAANRRGEFRSTLLTGAAKDNTTAINQRQDVRAAGQNQSNQFNAQTNLRGQESNQAAGLQANQQEIGRREGLAGAANQATAQSTQIEIAKHTKPKDPSFWDKALAAGTTLAAAGIANSQKAATAGATGSDVRLKEDVREVKPDAAERLASAIKTYEFKYKDDPTERPRVGVMAQDLERDPLGKKLVSKDEEGMRHVDYQGLTQLLLAAALRGKKEARR